MNLTLRAKNHHVDLLEMEGYIRREELRIRCIKLNVCPICGLGLKEYKAPNYPRVWSVLKCEVHGVVGEYHPC